VGFDVADRSLARFRHQEGAEATDQEKGQEDL